MNAKKVWIEINVNSGCVVVREENDGKQVANCVWLLNLEDWRPVQWLLESLCTHTYNPLYKQLTEAGYTGDVYPIPPGPAARWLPAVRRRWQEALAEWKRKGQP
jgi:hypothetical protein